MIVVNNNQFLHVPGATVSGPGTPPPVNHNRCKPPEVLAPKFQSKTVVIQNGAKQIWFLAENQQLLPNDAAKKDATTCLRCL